MLLNVILIYHVAQITLLDLIMFSLFGKPKNKTLSTNSSQYHRENSILIFDDLKAVLNKKTNNITKNQILYQAYSSKVSGIYGALKWVIENSGR